MDSAFNQQEIDRLKDERNALAVAGAEREKTITGLVEALRPFAALLNAKGLGEVGGGTSIAPSITVQMVKDAQAAIALEEAAREDEEDDEPHRVPCSFPKCTNLTTIDLVYGDLCYEHIRAGNE